jgi:Flp pilus assembly protein TadD
MAWTLSESQGRYDEALARINEVLQRVGKAPQFLDTRGVILIRLNRLDEAIQDLQTAADTGRDTPSLASIQFHLACALSKARRRDEARQALDTALKAGLKTDNLEAKERDDLKALNDDLAKPTKS